MKSYSENEIESKLSQLKNWNYLEGKLAKEFEFKNFSDAFAFLLKVGLLAEKQNHHPEIWNVYSKVTLKLSTHDAKGITEKDFKLANSIDDL